MPHLSDAELNRLRQSLDELATLNRISSAINVSMSVDQITQTIVEHSRKRVKASQGAIFLLESEEQQMDRFKTFVRDTSQDDGVIPFHLNQSLQGWMLKNRKPLLSNDPASDERLPGLKYEQIGLSSILAAPLLSRKGVIGILVLFNKEGDGGFDDSDQRFVGIVGTQVAKVIENAQLFEKEARLMEVEKELKIAQTIQTEFLPKENLAGERIEIFGHSTAAREVGGDYYDIVPLDDKRAFFSLGDVSGKGLPAALLTAKAQAVLRAQLYRGQQQDLSVIADCLNELIFRSTSPDKFITAVFGFADAEKMKIEYVNAGHMAPLIIRTTGEIEEPKDANLIIGVMSGAPYTILTADINPGDLFFLYTDGVTEAFNEKNELFGDDRLLNYLKANAGKTAGELCSGLAEELKTYRGNASQSDDITMLVVQVR